MIRPSTLLFSAALGSYLIGGVALKYHYDSPLSIAETSRLTAIGENIKNYGGTNVNIQLESVKDNISAINSNKNLPKLIQLEKEVESISKDLTTNNPQVYQPVLNKIGDDIQETASSEGTTGGRVFSAVWGGLIGTIVAGLGLHRFRNKEEDHWGR